MVIAIDRSDKKIQRLKEFVKTQEFENIKAYTCDSSSCVSPSNAEIKTKVEFISSLPESGSRVKKLPREIFDRILLDAPCSAIGQRPCFEFTTTKEDVDRHAKYQRSLLHAAVKLLKPGGRLVYSTCSFSIQENESNVAFALDTFPSLDLIPVSPSLDLGKQGCALSNDQSRSLTDREREMVQRFNVHEKIKGKYETIGFFYSVFEKKG
jgi:methyltransferase NSUN6